MMWPRGHGRAEPRERYRKKDRGVSYSGMWGCRSISSRSRPRDLRCSTTAGRPRQGSCKTERGDIYTTFTLRWFYDSVSFQKTFWIKNTCRAGDADTGPQSFFYCLLPTLSSLMSYWPPVKFTLKTKRGQHIT